MNGSDVAGLRTTAAWDGSAWVVNGSKTFITNGSSADLIVLAARTGRRIEGHLAAGRRG
jgi:alkylation response protein AidB-like acyl-CoA dehydrogenase